MWRAILNKSWKCRLEQILAAVPNRTVLFQIISFGISTQFSSIWPINRTLSSAITLGQSRPRIDGSKGCSAFPKAPAILEPRHQTRRKSLSPLQRCSRCILQSHPSRLVKIPPETNLKTEWLLWLRSLCYYAGLRHCNEWVRVPVALLRTIWEFGKRTNSFIPQS